MQTDKDSYAPGERIRVTVKSPESGRVTVLKLDPGGSVEVLDPAWRNVAVAAGQEFQVPAALPNGASDYVAAEPFGRTELLIVLTSPNGSAPDWQQLLSRAADSSVSDWPAALGRYSASRIGGFTVQQP